jgi:hypothetical protein
LHAQNDFFCEHFHESVSKNDELSPRTDHKLSPEHPAPQGEILNSPSSGKDYRKPIARPQAGASAHHIGANDEGADCLDEAVLLPLSRKYG